MKNKSLVITTALLLSLLGGTIGATASQLAQTPGDRQGQLQHGRKQVEVESSPLAPMGSGFTYQGRLVISGSPASGDYDFTFSLFDAATGGNQIGSTVTMFTQTLSIGTFTVALDFGSSVFRGDARWLQIGVRPSGSPTFTILSPRQALTASPYALSLEPGAVINGAMGAPLLSANNGSGHGLYGSSTGSGSAGVFGTSTSAYGVQGDSLAANGRGVYGRAFGTGGYGVYGTSTGGSGVWGDSTAINGTGVYGRASTGTTAKGVYGFSSSGTGVYGFAFDGSGVAGSSTDGHGGIFTSTTSSGVIATGAGNGVVGNSTAANGVVGISTAANFDGVVGVADTGSAAKGVYGSSANGAGVWGNSTSGPGVHGNSTNGSGVEGFSAGGYAMSAHGNVHQDRDKGGWAKAMVHVGGGVITYCYNSQQPAPNPISPCGFILTREAGGEYLFDFGFRVDDRFVLVTPEYAVAQAVIPTVSFPYANQVRIRTFSGGTSLIDSAFMVIVY